MHTQPHLLLMLLACIGGGYGYSLSSILTNKMRPALQVDVATVKSTSSSPFPSIGTDPISSLFSDDSHDSTENIYIHTLTLLDNLRSKPSCHRNSIGNLLSSCFELQRSPESSAVDNKKAVLASRIAICEFESAGIDYPPECRSLKGNDGDFGQQEACIRKLAERPQWWTTMSNSMQTVNVVCRSVGREVERDELLELHTSITSAQRELHFAIRKVLAEIITATEYQELFSEDMKQEFATILQEMGNMKSKMTESWRESQSEIVEAMLDMRVGADTARKETASLFTWLRQEIQNAQQYMPIWDVSIKRFWSEVETTGERAHANTKNLVDTVEVLTDSLKHSSADVTKALQEVLALAEVLSAQAISTKVALESQADQSREMLQELEEKLTETRATLENVQNSLQFSSRALDWMARYAYGFMNRLIVRVVLCTVLSLLAGMVSTGGPRRILEIGGILLCVSLLVTLPKSITFDPTAAQLGLISGATGTVALGAFYIRRHLQAKRREMVLEQDYQDYMRIFQDWRAEKKRAQSKWSFKKRGTGRRLVL